MDKSITTNTSRGIALGLFGQEVLTLIYDLRWLVLLSISLIIADFWYGMSEARMKKEVVRLSKAWRRTANKVVDYICLVLVAGILGVAIGEPLGVGHVQVAAVVMLLCIVFELNSIYGHICALNGVKPRMDIWRLLAGLLKAKSQAVGEAIENAEKTEVVTDENNK